MATDSGTTQRAHSNADVHAQEPGPGRNSRGLRRLATHDKPRYLSNYPPCLCKRFLTTCPPPIISTPGPVYIADGTLLPCWSWASRPELYPGSTRPPE
jgi:hypothetical protein